MEDDGYHAGRCQQWCADNEGLALFDPVGERTRDDHRRKAEDAEDCGGDADDAPGSCGRYLQIVGEGKKLKRLTVTIPRRSAEFGFT